MTRRREIPVKIEEGQQLDLEFFYRYLKKTYSFKVCYYIVSIEENSVKIFSVNTTSLVLGRLVENFFIENLFLKWFTEDVKFFRIKLNKILYNLSPTLQGSAFSTRDAETGVYLCSLVCENPSRTYKIKINGFCAPRSSFQAPILSDKLVPSPSENISIGTPENFVLNLSFFGITSTNQLSPVEVLESCD